MEVLDKYFGNVCELDLIFNFHKVRGVGWGWVVVVVVEGERRGGGACLMVAWELPAPSILGT